MDKIIKNTFNAFYNLRMKAESKPVDFELLALMAKCAEKMDYDTMKEIMDVFKPYMEGEKDDASEMLDQANVIYLRHGGNSQIGDVMGRMSYMIMDDGK